jgi:Putative MetA-pathway of phenol degradation
LAFSSSPYLHQFKPRASLISGLPRKIAVVSACAAEENRATPSFATALSRNQREADRLEAQLTREQFQSFIRQTFSSFHLLVTTPLGTYNPPSPINPSANRWMISPTVNFSYTPDQGWTWIETYVSGRIFSDNRNYLVNGAQTLSQKPILRLEEHLSRNLTDGLWLSVDAYYNLGGETSIDGVEQVNMANTLRIGGRNGIAAVARRRARAELRTRGRQTGERAPFADRPTYREATLVRPCSPVLSARF